MSSEIPFDKDSKQFSFINDNLKSASKINQLIDCSLYLRNALYFSNLSQPTDTIRHISSYL